MGETAEMGLRIGKVAEADAAVLLIRVTVLLGRDNFR